MNVPSIGSNFDISGYTAVKCTGNPNEDLKSFANANGLSLNDAKAILSGQYGAPKTNENTATNNNTATNTSNDANFATDDDSELDEGADLDDLDNDKTEDDKDDSSYTDQDLDNINSLISDIDGYNDENKNRYNNYMQNKSYETLYYVLQNSINKGKAYMDLADSVSNMDLSSLSAEQQTAIKDAASNLSEWGQKFKNANTALVLESTNDLFWSMVSTATQKSTTAFETLKSELQTAGLY